jgi:hypothetical protein
VRLLVEANIVELDDNVDDDNLDANHDDGALLCFHNIDDIIRLASSHGFAPCVLVAEELHVVSSNEPTIFTESECSPT